MELIRRKGVIHRVKKLIFKISDDNLFLLSSSISYYSALAIAPFVLILLSVASAMGQDLQQEFMDQAYIMSPQVGAMVTNLFQNVNKGITLGSISGIIGLVVLLYTASMVFLQFRYSFDIIYGYWNPGVSRTVWEIVRERIFAMLIVIMSQFFFILSILLSAITELVIQGDPGDSVYRSLLFVVNFLIYIALFTGIHYFAPSKHPPIRTALKIAVLSAVFFILGNMILASYLKGVASDNIYGAAGSLLVFLLWSYYSSFIIFLSVEIFLYFKKQKVKIFV